MRARFDAVAQPVAHRSVIDVHELESDIAGVDLVEHANHLIELHRLATGEKVGCDLFFEVCLGESEPLQVEAGVVGWGEAEWVDPRLAVTDGAVGVD